MRLDVLKPQIGMKIALLAVAVAVSVMSPIAGNRLIGFESWVLPAGAVFISMFYLMVDVLHELYGTRVARQTVWGAFFARLFVYLVMFPLVLALPSPRPDALGELVHMTFRLFIAGEVAPLVTNLLIDIPVFARLRQAKLPGGFFARTNLSNLVSVSLGTVLFMAIAFLGVRDIGPMITVGIVWRFGFALAVSPLAAAVVRMLDGRVDEQA